MGSVISAATKRAIAQAWNQGDGPMLMVPNQGLCYINSLAGQSYLKEGIPMGIPAPESPGVEEMLVKPLNGSEVVAEKPPEDPFDYAPLQADLMAIAKKNDAPYFLCVMVIDKRARIVTMGEPEIIMQLMADASMTMFPEHVKIEHMPPPGASNDN